MNNRHKHKFIKGGAETMEAAISRGVITTRSAEKEINAKSDWEEIAEWGSKLAKQRGLTKEDSRKILQHVRATSGRNCRY